MGLVRDQDSDNLCTRVRSKGPTISYPAAAHGQRTIIVVEHSLVDICDILGADRFELVNEQVTFVKRLRLGDSISWTAQLGDELIGQGTSWRVNSDRVVETPWSFVA